jgi:hypothetical protein
MYFNFAGNRTITMTYHCLSNFSNILLDVCC